MLKKDKSWNDVEKATFRVGDQVYKYERNPSSLNVPGTNSRILSSEHTENLSNFETYLNNRKRKKR